MNASISKLASIIFLFLIIRVMSLSCKYDFKVYVYEVPSHLKPVVIAEEARQNQSYHICQKCIYEQFALEYILYDFFTQFCGRTYNPNEADYFYLPIIRDLEYRIQLQTNNRDTTNIENVILELIEKNQTNLWKKYLNLTDTYWLKNNGANHIFIMPAPVTNFRHQTNARGFFHYLLQLTSPIFLTVEYSKKFVEEYPICSTLKNMVVPYPNTDYEYFNNKQYHPLTNNPNFRNKLYFYQGGNHGSCMVVRSALTKLMKIKTLAATTKQREVAFQQSIFCPIPIGDSPSSKRMYDVLNFGCVPVILSDDLVWAYTIETGGPLESTLFSIQLPQIAAQITSKALLQRQSTPQQKYTYLTLHPNNRSLLTLLEDAANNKNFSENSLANYLNLTHPIFKNELILMTHSFKTTTTTTTGNTNSISSTLLQNALLQILLRVEVEELRHLQQQTQMISSLFRYYSYNANMTTIPTSIHSYPDGGSIEMIANRLSAKKQRGIRRISDDCQIERFRPLHKYIGQYPCEKAGSQTQNKKRFLKQLDINVSNNVNNYTRILQNDCYDESNKSLTNRSDITSSIWGLWTPRCNKFCN